MVVVAWITLIVAAITAMLAYKTWRSVQYIEFSRDWLVTRASNEMIRLNGNIIITRRTTKAICSATLKLDKVKIPFDSKELKEYNPEGSYPVSLFAQYHGSLSGLGTLKLKLKLGSGRPKTFKTQVAVSIPDKVDSSIKLPNPADIANIFEHKPEI